jgi:Cellulose biosynthesis protein BcsS
MAVPASVRYVCVLRASVVMGCALAFALVSPSICAEPKIPTKTEKPLPKTVFFASFDATERSKGFTYGMKRALFSHLDQSGFRLMTMVGAKLREPEPLTGTRANRLDAARVLAGYEWQKDSLSLSLLGGASLVLHQSDAITLGQAKATHLGAMGMLELWKNWNGDAFSRWSSATLMVDQASRSIFFRIRHAVSLPGTPLTTGPEASISQGSRMKSLGSTVQEPWRTSRLGLHIGDIPLKSLRFTLSGGFEHRITHKNGAYGQLSAYMRY